MSKRGLLIAMVCMAATLQVGCFWFTPKSEGEALRKEVDYLNDRVQTLENETAEKQAEGTGLS